MCESLYISYDIIMEKFLWVIIVRQATGIYVEFRFYPFMVNFK